jgi:hypothetical protein
LSAIAGTGRPSGGKMPVIEPLPSRTVPLSKIAEFGVLRVLIMLLPAGEGQWLLLSLCQYSATRTKARIKGCHNKLFQQNAKINEPHCV